MAKQTSLQQLAQSIRDKRLIRQERKTPLTRSQQDPKTRKLAGMQALQREPRDPQPRDPNQLTIADAPNGQQFLEEHNASVRAIRSAAVDNFRFVDDNTRRHAEPVISSEQLRKAVTNTGLPNAALEALGTTVYATNRIPSAGRFSSGTGDNPFIRRGKIGIDSTDRGRHLSTPERHSVVLTHELGHEAESLARGKVGYGANDRELQKDLKLGPSASGEGFADGIARRFGGKESPVPTGVSDQWHTYYEGYKPESWNKPENQAAFIAHKTHAWTTGKLPEGSLPKRMYEMASNPHVRDALTAVDKARLEQHKSDSPYTAPQSDASRTLFDQDAPVHGPDQRLSGYVALKDVARNLSEQFMETRKTGRQLSLLDEKDEYDTYDVDKIDWDN